MFLTPFSPTVLPPRRFSKRISSRVPQEPCSPPLEGRQGLQSVDSNPNRATAFDTQLSDPDGRLLWMA